MNRPFQPVFGGLSDRNGRNDLRDITMKVLCIISWAKAPSFAVRDAILPKEGRGVARRLYLLETAAASLQGSYRGAK